MAATQSGFQVKQQPVDYPVNEDTCSDTSAVNPSEITYAALLDRFDSEQLITNKMIDQACRKIDTAQQFPFSVYRSDSSATSNTGQSALTPIRRLLRLP